MIDDPDEELRKARLPRREPREARWKSVHWLTIADSRRAQQDLARQQPPVLAGIARQIGADK
jgi:hypothetical protein